MARPLGDRRGVVGRSVSPRDLRNGILYGPGAQLLPLLAIGRGYFLLATLGAVNLTFPWASRMPAVRPTFFMVAHAAQLLVGFGALSGYLPICAHCKAIEVEDGSWEPLERCVTRRTDAAFSHGVCPPCFERHYEHLPEPDSARPGIAA